MRNDAMRQRLDRVQGLGPDEGKEQASLHISRQLNWLRDLSTPLLAVRKALEADALDPAPGGADAHVKCVIFEREC
jgi:hypothetical protein